MKSINEITTFFPETEGNTNKKNRIEIAQWLHYMQLYCFPPDLFALTHDKKLLGLPV